MLTVTRVECIPEVSTTTRGVDGRHKDFKKTFPYPFHHNSPNSHSDTQVARRAEVNTLLEQMTTFVGDIAPNPQFLSGPARDSAEEIMSAMFALNVADSGMNVALACQQVQTTAARVQMLDSGLQPELVKNLLCWIADHGYDFNTNRQEVYSTLQTALWGLGVAGGYTSNRTEICGNLGLFNTIGDYLGIHVAQYQNLVCANLPSAAPSINGSLNSTETPSSGSGNLTTSIPPSPWSSNATILGSGIPWRGGNSTTWGPPISFTGTVGSDWSTFGNPQTNNVTFLTGTAAASGMPGNPGANNVTFLTGTAAASGVAPGSPQTNNVTGPTGTGLGSGIVTGSPQTYNHTLPGGTGTASADSPATSQANNVTQPSGTDVASGTSALPLNQTIITTCTPPTPTAKLFFPAVSTTNSHYLFKGY